MDVNITITEITASAEIQETVINCTVSFDVGGGGGGDVTKSYVDQQDALKVDKVLGKSLISDTEKARLALVTNQVADGITITGIGTTLDPFKTSNNIIESTSNQGSAQNADSAIRADSSSIADYATRAGSSANSDYAELAVEASKAIHDGDGNNIVNTYATKGEVLSKVDKIDNYSLISDTEIDKLATVQANAEPNAANTVIDADYAADKLRLANTSGTNTGDQDLSGLIPKTQNILLKEPTGFTNTSGITITGNSTNRTVTLTGAFDAYYQGEILPEITNGWVSPAHGTDTAVKYFLSYDGTSIAWRTTLWGFEQLHIALAKYDIVNATWKYFRECHGLMQWQVHEELHRTIGTYRLTAGADFSDYTLNVANDASRRPQISPLTIYDEDLPTSIGSLTNKLYTQFRLTGSDLEAITLDASDIVRLTVNNPNYNLLTGSSWSDALMPANSVATIWVYAQPMAADVFSQKNRLIFVQPQWFTQSTNSSAGAINTAIASERLRNSSELNLNGLVTEEMVAIARLIIDYTGGNWRIRSVIGIYGSKVSQGNAPLGNYLTSVVTDATLTGTGTVASPIALATQQINGQPLTANIKLVESIGYAMSDNTSDITSGVKISAAAVPYNFTLTGVRAQVGTAAVGALLLTLDIKVNTVSIFTTKLTIDSTETVSETASTPYVLTASEIPLLTSDAIELSVNLAGGVTTAAKNLTLFLIGYKTI